MPTQMDALLALLHDMISVDKLVENGEEIQEDDLNQYYLKMEKIYSGGFRHSYSLLSSFLEAQSPDVYASLRLWLVYLAEYGENHYPERSTNKNLAKLLDHVELECIRLDRMKAVNRYAEESKRLAEGMNLTADKIEEKAKEASDNVKHYHEQSIGILSIFSAVILAFMGGISFSSGILGSIDHTSMFRLILTILLLGFILFNSIFILLRFVVYIIHQKFESERFKNGVWGFNAALAIILVVLILTYIAGGGKYIESWGGCPVSSSSFVQNN